MNGAQLDVDLSELNDAQLDGRACVRCGGESGPMVPVDLIRGVQTFVHAESCPS